MTRRKKRHALLTGLLLTAGTSQAGYYFDPAFLSEDPQTVADLSAFEQGLTAPPGTYRVDVFLNGQLQGNRPLRFIAGRDKRLQACLTPGELDKLGVRTAAFPALSAQPPDACIPLAQAIPQAESRADISRQRLDIRLPQAALLRDARGYIPPTQWDNGIPAALFNYSLSGGNQLNSDGGGNNSGNYYANLRSGINLGAWRLRDYSAWNYSQQQGTRWSHISTTLSRAVIALRSELTVGDGTTPSDVFDSLPFRGLQLASDDGMLPDSLRGFAPVVRGIAQSNARVSVRQNGYEIYQSYVPPGAFVIDDLYPTSSSGDLLVVVTEADGSENRYSVPYSSVPLLQREGRLRYALTAGKFRSSGDSQRQDSFGQLMGLWGLPYGITLYGGSQLAAKYQSAALGVGKNLGDWGALSFDITQANSTLQDDSKRQGQSLRFLYAKALNNWGTNLQLIGYRYSTAGFLTLDEAAQSLSGWNAEQLHYNKRGKWQANLSQQVGDGSLFITGSQQSYWHTDRTDRLLQMGYSGSLQDISYSLAWNYNQSRWGAGAGEQLFSLNLSLPLGRWLSGNGNNRTWANYSANSDRHGRLQQNAGVSGTLLADNNLSWNLQQGYANHGGGGNGNASLSYQGGYGNGTLGYNYSGSRQQVNYGLSGGVVVHANGVTLSQPLGDTSVLVSAPGAAGVRVENSTGVRTDWRGYAVVPYASNYRENRVALDTNTLGGHVELEDTVARVVPTKGALVRATFRAQVGYRALITLTRRGVPLPFGATVSAGSGAGIVGDNGQVYLSGLPANGQLTAQWGAGDARCVANYQLDEQRAAQTAVSLLKAECQ
ncbi:Outer membrane usher protein fimD precursor [Serratia quinivorans]|uniref:fimbrial biogenesis usher protein n=1 Tax=Serratia quinivorans TaxID=137545 RepID=UPI000D84BB87|nr:fimbrial biogenesis usher protein [Serratia quinivorans]SPZ66225.1 Outer membrane usher protein fimD precursor [Serratia quinivorans]VEI64822.1 Outer membrane usher protein fimD precursor [Serratia quinivorans]